MSNKLTWKEQCNMWQTELTAKQKRYLLKRYRCFYKALEVFIKAKATGMIDFEIIS